MVDTRPGREHDALLATAVDRVESLYMGEVITTAFPFQAEETRDSLWEEEAQANSAFGDQIRALRTELKIAASIRKPGVYHRTLIASFDSPFRNVGDEFAKQFLADILIAHNSPDAHTVGHSVDFTIGQTMLNEILTSPAQARGLNLQTAIKSVLTGQLKLKDRPRPQAITQNPV